MIADDGTRLEWLGSTLKYQRYRGRRANTLSSSAPIRRLKATSSHGEMACMGRTSRSRRPCARGEVLCTEPGKMGQKRKCPGLRGTPFYPQEQTSSACPGMSVANNRPTSVRNNGMPNYAVSQFARDVGRSKIMTRSSGGRCNVTEGVSPNIA